MQDFDNVAASECVYMGNSRTTRAMGKWTSLLKFTSCKLLSSSNVLFVPFLCRNLVSDISTNKARLAPIVGDDKIMISRNGVFGKGYLNESLFVLNPAFETMNGNASSFTFIAKSVVLWHSSFSHVNFASIK